MNRTVERGVERTETRLTREVKTAMRSTLGAWRSPVSAPVWGTGSHHCFDYSFCVERPKFSPKEINSLPAKCRTAAALPAPKTPRWMLPALHAGAARRETETLPLLELANQEADHG